VSVHTGQTRVLSPELALVDHELAAWARLRLQEEAVAARVAAAAAVEAPAPVAEPKAVDRVEPEERGRSLWPLALATGIAAGIIAVVAVAVRPSSHDSASPEPAAATGTTRPSTVPFAWPGVSAAHAYVFTLSRGTKVIYRARTTAEQLALKRSWKYQGRRYKLTRGAYRWRVTALVASASNGTRTVVSAPFWIDRSG
jgi:hypothetical protein